MAVTAARAQMLLIGAITLAVLLISLSVVLNGSVATVDRAGQASEDASVTETVALQTSVQRDVGAIIAGAHDENPDDFHGPDGQENYVDENVTDLGDYYADYYARQDRIVAFGSHSVQEGRRFEQTGGDFTEPGGTNPTWTVSSGTEIRKFDIDVDSWPGTGPFAINVDDGSDTWQIRLSDVGDAVVVSGPESGSCDAPVSEPRIEVTNATVQGEPCPALEFFEDLGSGYAVEFENGDQIAGSYSMFVSDPAATGPNPEEVVYAVEVDLVDRSPRVSYEGTVRVAPGEPA